MRCDGRFLGVLAAVTKGLFILWAVPGQARRAPTLQQIQSLVGLMAEDAQELFTFYEKDQRLAFNNICHTSRPPEWLQGSVLGSEGLRGLRGTMIRMAQALQDITRHQRDLNPPGAEILQRLASTHQKVRGLLSNLDGLFPVPSSHPAHWPPLGPTPPTKVFQQKLQGCWILWSYANFMAKLNTQLEARSRQAHREKRRSRKGSRAPRVHLPSPELPPTPSPSPPSPSPSPSHLQLHHLHLYAIPIPAMDTRQPARMYHRDSLSSHG